MQKVIVCVQHLFNFNFLLSNQSNYADNMVETTTSRCHVVRGSSLQRSFVSVDGTDLKIKEPSPFTTKWYPHKHNGPGVRYEAGIYIRNGEVVWANGPFLGGSNSDPTIFRQGMNKFLQEGERVLADRGYLDSLAVAPNSERYCYKRFDYCSRARHETFNGGLKSFHVLGGTNRH